MGSQPLHASHYFAEQKHNFDIFSFMTKPLLGRRRIVLLVHLLMNLTKCMHAPASEAVRVAARPAIRWLIRLSEEITQNRVNRIVLDEESRGLPSFGALARRQRLGAFPDAIEQLIQILAQSLAVETIAVRQQRPSA